MQLDPKALIEEAVQASIDAGLAVNGEYGVAAARHAARFMLKTLQAVQPVPVIYADLVNDQMEAKLRKIIRPILKHHGIVNGVLEADLTSAIKPLTATASAEPVDDGFQGFVQHGSYCATEGCGNFATVHFIRGGIGSLYCQECYLKVQALGRSPSSTGRQSG